jgi:hypothetical protein
MKNYYKDDAIPGMRHRFDQKMHDKYDIPARENVKKALGDFVKDHPNPYKQDLIITSPTCKYKYLELQVCSNWISPIDDKYDTYYPYKNVWIYARKSLYGDDTLFLTLNKGMTKGYLFDAQSIKDVKPRRLKKYSREFVYDIPWNRVMKVSLDELNKEIIELY